MGFLEGLTGGLCPLEGTESEKGEPLSQVLAPLTSPPRALLGLCEL